MIAGMKKVDNLITPQGDSIKLSPNIPFNRKRKIRGKANVKKADAGVRQKVLFSYII